MDKLLTHLVLKGHERALKGQNISFECHQLVPWGRNFNHIRTNAFLISRIVFYRLIGKTHIFLRGKRNFWRLHHVIKRYLIYFHKLLLESSKILYNLLLDLDVIFLKTLHLQFNVPALSTNSNDDHPSMQLTNKFLSYKLQCKQPNIILQYHSYLCLS